MNERNVMREWGGKITIITIDGIDFVRLIDHDHAMKKVEADRASEKQKCQKPPLGIKPAFIAIDERNEALAEAVIRHSHRCAHSIEETSKIRLWAQEIVCNCDTLLELLRGTD